MENKNIVTFGEILLRFTPQNNKLLKEASAFDCFYGGSEANVAIGLAALGDNTSYITILPDNDLGDSVKNNLIDKNVDISNIIFKGNTLGSYYLQTGIDGISSSVIYNRKNSEIANATVDEAFDYNKIFNKCHLFHISGISFALSDSCRKLCFEFIKEARKRGIPVSFDFNYRQKLWTIDEAALVYKEILPLVDIVFCSTKDIEAFLDNKSKEDIIKEYDCKYLIVRDRVALTPVNQTPIRHKVNACIYMNSKDRIIQSSVIEREFEVIDRVGSGDAFSVGVLHSLLNDPNNIDKALEFGIATFVIKHSIPGDYLTVSEKEVYDRLNKLNNFKNITKMSNPRICLSISERDEAFDKMVEELGAVATVDVVDLNITSLQGYDIFIGKKLSKAAVESADKLKAIFAYKTGVDDFPLDEIKKRNILLVNSHANAHIIAQYALGLAISLVNRITEFDRKFRAGVWYDLEVPYWESFFNMKIGLLGYGCIGKEVHKLIKSIGGMEVLTLNRGKKYDNITLVDSMEELCKKSDILILSLPKTKDTDAILNEKTLGFLKGKYVVNVGRSNAINQRDLFEALGGNLKMEKIKQLKSDNANDFVVLTKDERANYLAGVAIDTWDSKAKKNDSKFYPFDKDEGIDFTILDNIILSPHQAMKVIDGHENYVKDITNKVLDYINGKNIEDTINLKIGY